jgi:urease accessory protein
MSFLLWQLVDSGFPSGGFAHSGGLEASVHHGQVHDAESLRAFTRQTVAQAGRAALPLVTAVHREPQRLGELDQLCDAFLTNPIAKRASRAQGRALLTSTSRSFPHAKVDALEARVRRDQLHGHYAAVFGAVLSLLGVAPLDTQRLFLFLAGRGVCSAAVRLGLIGAYEAQELQTLVGGDIDRVIATCGQLGPFEISQTAPLIDLCQSTHDRLYSRLFQS